MTGGEIKGKSAAVLSIVNRGSESRRGKTTQFYTGPTETSGKWEWELMHLLGYKKEQKKEGDTDTRW